MALEVEGDGGFVGGKEVRGGVVGAVDAQDGGAVVGEQEAAEGAWRRVRVS